MIRGANNGNATNNNNNNNTTNNSPMREATQVPIQTNPQTKPPTNTSIDQRGNIKENKSNTDNTNNTTNNNNNKKSRNIKSIGSKFTNEALRHPHESIIESLYDSNATQCIQCGFRFKDESKMNSHYDWHFRKNSAENKNKPSSRDWFLPVEEWIDYQGLEDIQSGRNFFFYISPF